MPQRPRWQFTQNIFCNLAYYLLIFNMPDFFKTERFFVKKNKKITYNFLLKKSSHENCEDLKKVAGNLFYYFKRFHFAKISHGIDNFYYIVNMRDF